MLRLHHGVVLRTGFGIDDKQAVRAETEPREGGEERQIDLSYLVLGSNELIRCLAGDGCQPLGREDHVYSDGCHRYYSQHNAQKRPADYFESTFHGIIVS